MAMSLPVTAAPYLAATILLGAAGVAKTARPGRHGQRPARRRALLPPAPGRRPGRSGGRGGSGRGRRGRSRSADRAPWSPRAYAGFAVFILVALRRGWALSSCGCFGRPDTPPTPAHAVLNAGAAASAVWWAGGVGVAGPRPGRAGWAARARSLGHSDEPWHGGPLALLVVVLCGLAYLIWTDPLPAARR